MEAFTFQVTTEKSIKNFRFAEDLEISKSASRKSYKFYNGNAHTNCTVHLRGIKGLDNKFSLNCSFYNTLKDPPTPKLQICVFLSNFGIDYCIKKLVMS